MHCDHNIPETKKGSGPCDIRFEVKKRNGKPLHWCHTHGMEASAPDGAALTACVAAWWDPVPDEMRLDIDVRDGEVAVWGALPPAIAIGKPPLERGGVHVHRRALGGTDKDIDRSFDIVSLSNGETEITVESMAARARSISELAGRSVVALPCSHCGELHIDELMFAATPHVKHQCNSCGRNFWDRSPSISNPLAAIQADLGLKPPPSGERVTRPLELRSQDYDSIALWPSNSAIVSTMTRPEEVGVHVHGWRHADLVLDETYSPVTLNGVLIDQEELRLLAVQQSLAESAPVVSLDCASCGKHVTTSTETWLRPSTTHPCAACGCINRTRRRCFLNPLAAIDN